MCETVNEWTMNVLNYERVNYECANVLFYFVKCLDIIYMIF
jgi:hypothetical protein